MQAVSFFGHTGIPNTLLKIEKTTLPSQKPKPKPKTNQTNKKPKPSPSEQNEKLIYFVERLQFTSHLIYFKQYTLSV